MPHGSDWEAIARPFTSVEKLLPAVLSCLCCCNSGAAASADEGEAGSVPQTSLKVLYVDALCTAWSSKLNLLQERKRFLIEVKLTIAHVTVKVTWSCLYGSYIIKRYVPGLART